MQAAFEIIEPDGNVIKIFANGTTEGLKPGCLIFNRIPQLLRERNNTLSIPSCPASNAAPSRAGAEHSAVPETESRAL